MTDDLIFEEPPTSTMGRRAGEPLRRWLDALRSHPGQWAKYPTDLHAAASHNIRHGLGYGAKPGEFEVRTQTVKGDARHRQNIWVRYVATEVAS